METIKLLSIIRLKNSGYGIQIKLLSILRFDNSTSPILMNLCILQQDIKEEVKKRVILYCSSCIILGDLNDKHFI